jgi:hypothetical protein
MAFPGLILGSDHDVDEEPMHTAVVGEFRMKRGGKQMSLAHQDRKLFAASQDIDAGTGGGDARGANEDHLQRSAWQRRRFDKDRGVDLAAVGISLHCGIEEPQTALRGMAHFTGEQDGAGAGAKDGVRGSEVLKRLEEVAALQELEDGGGFAAGQDEPVEGLSARGEVLGGSYERRNRSGFDKSVGVRRIVTLDGKDADAGAQSFCVQFRSSDCDYQPRVWRSCDSSIAAAARPFMVPVTCSLTSARIAGSL